MRQLAQSERRNTGEIIMLKLKWVRPVLVLYTCSISFAVHAYAADPQRIDVPAGDLTAALESLARQSDIELVYRIEQLKGLRTRGVSGTLTSYQAGQTSIGRSII